MSERLIRNGRTMWIVDAHRGDGKRYVVRADEKLITFIELESAIRGSAFALTICRRFITLGTDTKA